MVHSIVSIAKKEIMDNVRNKWIIIIAVLFASLTLLVSYAGSLGSGGWQDLGLTVAGMRSLVQFLISIVGLMLGYAAIGGEIERGSMGSLLAEPTLRRDILLGKFLGLGAVLTFTILIGFGIAGLVIGLNVPDVDYGEYLVFIGASILIGLVFLSLGLFVSCFFQKRSTAMGAAIFIWFLFSIIWIFIVAGLLVATGALEDLASFAVPDWYFAFNLFNPLEVYATLVTLNIGAVTAGSEEIGGLAYPGYYTSELMVLLLVLWILVLFLLAHWRFAKRDI